jgi:hypothetical protein
MLKRREKSEVENEYLRMSVVKPRFKYKSKSKFNIGSQKQNNNKKHISMTQMYSNANQGSRHA